MSIGEFPYADGATHTGKMAAVDTFGSLLQLLGAIITGAGLFYAWNRASRRFDEWRGTLQTRLKELRAFVVSLGRALTREAFTDLAVAVNDTVGIKDEVETELTRGGTVEERLRRVEKEAEDLVSCARN